MVTTHEVMDAERVSIDFAFADYASRAAYATMVSRIASQGTLRRAIAAARQEASHVATD